MATEYQMALHRAKRVWETMHYLGLNKGLHYVNRLHEQVWVWDDTETGYIVELTVHGTRFEVTTHEKEIALCRSK